MWKKLFLNFPYWTPFTLTQSLSEYFKGLLLWIRSVIKYRKWKKKKVKISFKIINLKNVIFHENLKIPGIFGKSICSLKKAYFLSLWILYLYFITPLSTTFMDIRKNELKNFKVKFEFMFFLKIYFLYILDKFHLLE